MEISSRAASQFQHEPTIIEHEFRNNHLYVTCSASTSTRLITRTKNITHQLEVAAGAIDTDGGGDGDVDEEPHTLDLEITHRLQALLLWPRRLHPLVHPGRCSSSRRLQVLPVTNEDSVSLGGFLPGEEQLVAVFSDPIYVL